MKTNQTVYVVMCDDMSYGRELWTIAGIFESRKDAENLANTQDEDKAQYLYVIKEHQLIERSLPVTINDLIE